MIRAANALAEARRVDGLAGHGAGPSRTGRRWQADPRGGHRHLGRHGRGRPVHRQGRPVRPRAAAGSTARAGSRRRPGVPGPARASCSAPAPARRCRRSTGWPARRTGPTARRSRSRSCRRRCWCSAAARSGWSWRRSSPGSGSGSPWSRRWTGCWPSRSRRRPRWPPRRCAPTAWRSTPGYGPSGSTHDGDAVHRARWPTARRSPARSCWWRPAAGPSLAELGLDTIGLDADRALPRRSTTGCTPAERVWAVGDVTGEGAFTHVAMYQAGDRGRRHPGPGRAGRPTTAALPRVTFTDPGGRRGRAHRAAGPRAGHQRAGRARPSCRSAGAGSTGPATTASSSWSRTPTRAC